MSLRHLKRFSLFAWITLVFCKTFGQPYQVDFMVFEQKADSNNSMASHELWPTYLPTPYPASALHLIDAGEALFNPLPKDQQLLAFHEKRLAQSDNYRVLWHKSWIQPLAAESYYLIINNSEETPKGLLPCMAPSKLPKHFQQWLNL